MKMIDKSIYFASDMHFGYPDKETSLKRELLFVQWLDEISADASDVYIMGDLFDFWFEWKYVVTKGYIRLLGKIAELSDKGIQFHFFTGNHDMWMFSYLQKELGVYIYYKDKTVTLQNKTLYLSHGDVLGRGGYANKFMKRLFANDIAQWCYARFHPDFAVKLAFFFSRKSRYSNQIKNAKFINRENKLTDRQIIYAKEILKTQHIDYFIFGHQHKAVKTNIGNNTIVFNIGNWLNIYTFLQMRNGEIKHKTYINKKTEDLDVIFP